MNEKSDNLLIELEQFPDFLKPLPTMVENIEKFLPSWMALPVISAAIGANV